MKNVCLKICFSSFVEHILGLKYNVLFCLSRVLKGVNLTTEVKPGKFFTAEKVHVVLL